MNNPSRDLGQKKKKNQDLEEKEWLRKNRKIGQDIRE